MRITLLITGSIAAYKGAEIVRELKKRGHNVRVALSESAKEFITPLTLQTLSGNPVATSLFDLEEESRIGHISLADATDLILVAPATADFIAKAAHGLASDLPTTILLATKAPILIAPAMNVNMWENSITQKNIELLNGRKITVLEPGDGDLACGWEGKGRLQDPIKIIESCERILNLKKTKLNGKRVIVTAGPTREMIDPMRFISNRSSGKTGIAIAKAAAEMGATVTLLLGAVDEDLQIPNVKILRFNSAVELQKKVTTELKDTEEKAILFMAAAVADFRASEISPQKLKQSKEASQSLVLVPNPDILKGIGESRDEFPKLEILVGFSAESENLAENATEKLQRKRCDFIVGNLIRDSVEGDKTELSLFSTNGLKDSSGKMNKLDAAKWLIDAVINPAVKQ